MTEFTKDLDTGLIVPEEETPEQKTAKQKAKSDTAYKLVEELKKFKAMLNYSYVHAGQVLEEILSTKAYKDVGFKSFAAFLSDADYGMPKSTAYLYLHIYRFYCIEMTYTPESLMDLDIVRLRDLIPVIKKDKTLANEWLNKARTLGKIDFINELRHAKGLDVLEFIPASPDENEVVVVRTDYSELCRASACIVCGKRPVDFHHFPKSKGAGADDDKVIPLCRECHCAFHQDPKTFLWQWREKIFDWFYTLVFSLLGIKETK